MKRTFTLFLIGFLLALFLFQPSATFDGATFGMQLVANKLLPYLLPYLVISSWFTSLFFTKVPTKKDLFFYLQLYIIGALGGYPSGAATVHTLREQNLLSKYEASHLTGIMHAPSPIFLIGYIGAGLLHSIPQGIVILVLLHLTNILLLVLFVIRQRSRPVNYSLEKEGSASFSASVAKGSQIMMQVATTVIFFTAVSENIVRSVEKMDLLQDSIFRVIIYSFFEMTAGLESASYYLSSASLFSLIVLVIVIWNGLSIHMQVFVIAKSSELSFLPYIMYRLMSAIFILFISFLYIFM